MGADLYHEISGSIPACAGETVATVGAGNRGGVDPRVRGGDIRESVFHAGFQGRSPRARGRLSLCPPPMTDPRSIPACAGETAIAGAIGGGVTVDPRVRGGDR